MSIFIHLLQCAYNFSRPRPPPATCYPLSFPRSLHFQMLNTNHQAVRHIQPPEKTDLLHPTFCHDKWFTINEFHQGDGHRCGFQKSQQQLFEIWQPETPARVCAMAGPKKPLSKRQRHEEMQETEQFEVSLIWRCLNKSKLYVGLVDSGYFFHPFLLSFLVHYHP